MAYFATSDLHFAHENIIKHCGRPFRSVEGMNDALVWRYNNVVKPEDTTFILGDLCFRSKGSPKAAEWLSRLNGNKVLVRGNHDNNNSAKTILRVAYVEFMGMAIAMIHDPVVEEDQTHGGVGILHPWCHYAGLVLCGHVHEKWKHRWYLSDRGRTLAINVGVDQWGFRPVSLDELVRYHDGVLKIDN